MIEAMTNHRVARKVGCHASTVGRWRKGERLPGVIYLDRLARRFHIPRQELQDAWERAQAERARSGKYSAFALLLEDRVFDAA